MKKTLSALLLVSLLLALVGCRPQLVGNAYTPSTGYHMDFSVLNRTEKAELSLKDGESLRVIISLTEGSVALTISGDEGEAYRGNDLKNEAFTVGVPAGGRYYITVTGSDAAGKVEILKRDTANGS